eukprot:tig00021179_g19222.t1
MATPSRRKSIADGSSPMQLQLGVGGGQPGALPAPSPKAAAGRRASISNAPDAPKSSHRRSLASPTQLGGKQSANAAMEEAGRHIATVQMLGAVERVNDLLARLGEDGLPPEDLETANAIKDEVYRERLMTLADAVANLFGDEMRSLTIDPDGAVASLSELEHAEHEGISLDPQAFAKLILDYQMQRSKLEEVHSNEVEVLMKTLQEAKKKGSTALTALMEITKGGAQAAHSSARLASEEEERLRRAEEESARLRLRCLALEARVRQLGKAVEAAPKPEPVKVASAFTPLPGSEAAIKAEEERAALLEAVEEGDPDDTIQQLAQELRKAQLETLALQKKFEKTMGEWWQAQAKCKRFEKTAQIAEEKLEKALEHAAQERAALERELEEARGKLRAVQSTGVHLAQKAFNLEEITAELVEQFHAEEEEARIDAEWEEGGWGEEGGEAGSPSGPALSPGPGPGSNRRRRKSIAAKRPQARAALERAAAATSLARTARESIARVANPNRRPFFRRPSSLRFATTDAGGSARGEGSQHGGSGAGGGGAGLSIEIASSAGDATTPKATDGLLERLAVESASAGSPKSSPAEAVFACAGDLRAALAALASLPPLPRSRRRCGRRRRRRACAPASRRRAPRRRLLQRAPLTPSAGAGQAERGRAEAEGALGAARGEGEELRGQVDALTRLRDAELGRLEEMIRENGRLNEALAARQRDMERLADDAAEALDDDPFSSDGGREGESGTGDGSGGGGGGGDGGSKRRRRGRQREEGEEGPRGEDGEAVAEAAASGGPIAAIAEISRRVRRWLAGVQGEVLANAARMEQRRQELLEAQKTSRARWASTGRGLLQDEAAAPEPADAVSALGTPRASGEEVVAGAGRGGSGGPPVFHPLASMTLQARPPVPCPCACLGAL